MADEPKEPTRAELKALIQEAIAESGSVYEAAWDKWYEGREVKRTAAAEAAAADEAKRRTERKPKTLWDLLSGRT